MTITYHLPMWQETQVEKLRYEIEELLAPLSDVAGLYDLARDALTQARRGLAPGGAYDTPWPLLPMMVCEAISGHYENALPSAAALQLLMAAGDVFDDIEDADSSESLSARYGSAVATNVATALLILAERAITRFKTRGVADRLTVCVMDTINSCYITACAGQHLDLSIASEPPVSEDMYLRIVGMKSASQIECACRVGVLLANANQELIDKFNALGHNLGMAAQITNDIQGVTYGSDIMKRKITLPVVFALNHTEGEACSQLDLVFGKQSASVPDSTQIRDLLFRTGAIHYATVKMEFYRQQALDILSEVERLGANTERLKLFLE